jgi:hypothetical protein
MNRWEELLIKKRTANVLCALTEKSAQRMRCAR